MGLCLSLPVLIATCLMFTWLCVIQLFCGLLWVFHTLLYLNEDNASVSTEQTRGRIL